MNKKQRIVHGQGTSNMNYSTIVFNFDICRLSLPVSSTNYGVENQLSIGVLTL